MSRHTDRAPGIRLSIPPDPAHVALVRACLRDVIPFRTEHAEHRFLLAVSEITVSAIDATNARQDGSGNPPPVTIEWWGPSPGTVEVHDRAGGFDPSMQSIRRAVDADTSSVATGAPAMTVEAHARGTRVTLELDGLT